MLQRALRRWRGTVADPGPLYRAVVGRARAPALFRAGAVPDTLDGRFESLVLHLLLVLRRLRGEAAPEAAALSQGLIDTFFVDMDESLREIGVGDLSVGRKVKTMASAFYGRAEAYERALAAGADALRATLARNMFGTVRPDDAALDGMVAYVNTSEAALAEVALADLLAGRAAFGRLAGEDEETRGEE